MESKKETNKKETFKPENKKIKSAPKLTFEEELFLNIKPNIIIKGSFRYIENYSYTYRSYVKQRWEKRTILDVFSKEFRAETADYYVILISIVYLILPETSNFNRSNQSKWKRGG